MKFEQFPAEKPEKEDANAERKNQGELLQEFLDLTQLENWLNAYAATHYPAENEKKPELTLNDVLNTTRKKIRLKRATPEHIMNDLKCLTQLNHTLPKNERFSPTMEMTLEPDNAHENWSERALSVELRKNMTLEEAVKVLSERKNELKEMLKGQ